MVTLSVLLRDVENIRYLWKSLPTDRNKDTSVTLSDGRPSSVIDGIQLYFPRVRNASPSTRSGSGPGGVAMLSTVGPIFAATSSSLA